MGALLAVWPVSALSANWRKISRLTAILKPMKIMLCHSLTYNYTLLHVTRTSGNFQC